MMMMAAAARSSEQSVLLLRTGEISHKIANVGGDVSFRGCKSVCSVDLCT